MGYHQRQCRCNLYFIVFHGTESKTKLYLLMLSTSWTFHKGYLSLHTSHEFLWSKVEPKLYSFIHKMSNWDLTGFVRSVFRSYPSLDTIAKPEYLLTAKKKKTFCPNYRVESKYRSKALLQVKSPSRLST